MHPFFRITQFCSEIYSFPCGAWLRLHFTNAEGLRTRDGKEVQCLFISAEGRIFKPAVSRICGESLEVWHPETDRPHAVRYAWADNPIGANLVNAADLPASPFKTH